MKSLAEKEPNLSGDYFHDPALKDKKSSLLLDEHEELTPREYLIKLAKKEREKNPDIFTNYIISDIKSSPEKKFVIIDCRYKRELDKLKEEFYYDKLVTIWISRKDKVKGNDNIEVTHMILTTSFSIMMTTLKN